VESSTSLLRSTNRQEDAAQGILLFFPWTRLPGAYPRLILMATQALATEPFVLIF